MPIGAGKDGDFSNSSYVISIGGQKRVFLLKIGSPVLLWKLLLISVLYL